MPLKYPFLDRLRHGLESLEDPKSMTWLADKLGKTPRTLYNMSDFEKLALGDIQKISSLLEINFIDDYNRWLIANHQEPLSLFNEPEVPYEQKVNRVTISIKISAPEQIAEDNLSRMISEIRKSGEILGFKID